MNDKPNNGTSTGQQQQEQHNHHHANGLINDNNLSFWIKWESYFFNNGAAWAFWTFCIVMNIMMGVWGVWLFTVPHWTTTNDILRITLPIARGSGRIVTWNSSLLLLTACKFFITWIRANTVIPYGFPIDNIMPEYHRFIASTLIIMGCIVHTAPQVYNYATQTLIINGTNPIWNFTGETLSTRSLLYTGIILWFTFVMFSISTLQSIRRTTNGFRCFWALHIIGITLAIPNLLVHGTILGTPITFYFTILPLLLYSIDVFLRKVYYTSRQCTVVSIIPHIEEKVTELHINVPSFDYTPGQYAEIKIPQIANYEWHPFTIASAPNTTKKARTDDTKSVDVILTFYIKATGRWTNALYDIANQRKNNGNDDDTEPISVSIRGPFGAPAQNYFLYKHIVIIGSGIGVTPLLSIWNYIVNQVTATTSTMFQPDKLEYRMTTRKIDLMSSYRATNTTSNVVDVDDGDDPTYTGTYDADTGEEWEEDHILNDLNPNYIGIQNFTHVRSSSYRTTSNKSILRNSVTDSTQQQQQQQQHEHEQRQHRIYFAYLASILESMTVNVCIFCFSITMEMVVFCVWIFNNDHEAAIVQIVTSLVLVLLFGSKIITSIIAYGKRYYQHSFVFKLDFGIFILSTLSPIFATSNLLVDSNAFTIAYFVFFVISMLLHLTRIFHIFYSTARPPSYDVVNKNNNSSSNTNKDTSTLGGTDGIDGESNGRGTSLKSVTGIWVAQKYSSMSYAAPVLIKDFLHLCDKFSLYMYATRDKQYDLDNVDPFPPERSVVDFDLAYDKFTQRKNYHLVGGRPDWEHLFTNIINKVHDDPTTTDGEAIGVFFCGSPAIACALQNAAYRVNAQHQHITKKQCQCRILIHKENF